MFCSTKIAQKNIFFDFILKKKLLKIPIYYIFALAMQKKRKDLSTRYRSVLSALIMLFCSLHGMAETVQLTAPEKPYVSDSVLHQIYRQAAIYATAVKEYKADLYLKGNLQLHKRNRIVKYLPSMFRFEKNVNEYIHESLSELHFTSPRIYDRKIRAVSTTFPGGSSRFFDILDFLKFNLYAPAVMGDKILSPLNEQASIHYTYLLDSIDYQKEGEWYKIKFIPRYRSTQLLEGFFWISTSDWTLRKIHFKGAYNMLKFKVHMQMGNNEEDRLLPQLFNINFNFIFLKNHIEMDYTGWMTYNSIQLATPEDLAQLAKRKEKWFGQDKEKFNLSSSYVLTCDTNSLVQSRDSFARIRPLPLTNYEDSLYMAFDERRKIHPEDTLKKEETRLKKNLVYMGEIGDALISSYNIDMSNIGSITCSPIINPLLVSYSHRNGFAYRQEFKYNKLFHDGKLLHIVPQIGYNFTKKELYAMLDGEFVYNPLKNGSFGISVGNGNRIYSSIVLDQLKERNDTALFSFENLNLDYFKDVYLNLSHNIEVVNGLKLWTGISMHWRHVAENNPDVASRVRLKYNSFAPRIRVEWTPNMYYYINGNRKVNVGSYYPTFIFDYERGFKLMKNSGEYERFEFSAEQKIRIRNLHTIAYHIGGGFFTNQQDMYFVDYVNFANRNLPEGWNDDIGGTFQMLDGRWYNASRHYFRGNITYETPFLLLYPVSKLLSFVQKERIYAGILFMPYLHPYFELGYGIGTHVFDCGAFIGNENGKFTSVGFKFTFELFNK